MSRAVNWCFTINNAAGDDNYDLPRTWGDNVRYCVWQSEVGESGTEHLQGYLVLNERMRLTQMKNLCYAAHWAARAGTHEQAKLYCMKDDNRIAGPWEIGSEEGLAKKKGQRTDLDALKRDLDNPELELADVANNHFGSFLRYHKGIQSYLVSKVRHRANAAPKVYIYWGPTGTGKSRKAAQQFPNAYRKMKSDWWQGYKGENEVIFDDFYGWIAYDELLRILDWYRMEMPLKGTSAPLSANTFIFTSNKPWYEWYPKVKDTSALKRRVEEFATVEFMDADVIPETSSFDLQYNLLRN